MKPLRAEGVAAAAFSGGGPGKRKRGYYRALKRGELWALNKQFIESMNQATAEALFYRLPPVSL